MDNYSDPQPPDVEAWLERHPRITLHFTPTSGSWLNLVEGTSRSEGPTYLIRLLAPLPGTPYRVLQFDAATGPVGGTFDTVTFRYDQASNSDLSYIWEHRSWGGSVAVGRRTRRAHLAAEPEGSMRSRDEVTAVEGELFRVAGSAPPLAAMADRRSWEA